MAAPVIERAFGVTNIKSHIPIILDCDDHNYDAWIYGTLSQPLFQSSFQSGGTARDIWVRIENQFRNNKEARAIQLDNELRTTEIGDLSIKDYCQKLKGLSDLLTNVDAPISDRTLVMYLLNGLNEKFDYIINVIKHKDPFTSFEAAKSMLELEESRLKKAHKPSASHGDHSSSSSALIVSDNHSVPATHPQPQQQRNNTNGNNRGNQNRRNNNNNRFRGKNHNNQQPRPNFSNWGPNPNVFWPNAYMGYQWQNQLPPWMTFPQQVNNRSFMGSRPPSQYFNQAHIVDNVAQPTTDFAHALNTMTLADPNAGDWYMDTGATAHLAASAGSSNSENSSPQ